MTAVVAPGSAGLLTRVQAVDHRKVLQWVPILLILAAQAVLSVRLLPNSYVSGDEGRYIYAGHQLIYELWHGGGSPYYETSFSGAPVIYPVLAAMADHLGGLLEVCLMSLAFMLTATVTLFSVTRRLFGYLSSVLAAGLFAGFGITQDLGALATYDAMALMLMTMATYCAARTADSEKNASRWLLAVPAMLLLANATKYATVIFDPVVILLATLQVSNQGWRRMATRLMALGLATSALVALALFVAGGSYLNGLLFSTLSRASGASTIFAAAPTTDSFILSQSWQWMGLAIAGCVVSLAVVILWQRNWQQAAHIFLFLVAASIVTIEGLHLHTVESMRKHDDFAAWFGCMGSGSVVSSRLHQGRRIVTGIFAVLVTAGAVLSGVHYSQLAASTFEAGGSQTTLEVAATLKPYLQLPNGRYLIGGLASEQLIYMDSASVPWYQLSDDLYIKYPIPGRGGDSHGRVRGRACLQNRPGCMYLEGIAGYRAAIRAHWFDLICMWGDHRTAQDSQIEQAVEHTPGYALLSHVGNAPTWIYLPAYRHLPRQPT